MDLKLDIKGEVQGRFKFTTSKADGTITNDTDWFNNIVLDQGLEALGTTGVLAYCRVGTGSSIPEATQKELDAQVAYTSDTQSHSHGANPEQGFYWVRVKYRFGIGVAVGNLTEVGVGWGATGATLFNRAMIRDAQNVPTTVTVLEDEVLDVTVELRSYVSLLPKNSTVFISGVSYNIKTQALLTPLSQYSSSGPFENKVHCYSSTHNYTSGYAGEITGYQTEPEGLTSYFNVSNWNYVPGSKTAKFELYWGLNSGNSNPLKTIVTCTSIAKFQTEFTPSIPKTSETILRIVQSVSWGRYVET